MSKPTWLVFFSNGSAVDEYFSPFNLPFDCNVMASIENRELDEEIITEVYRIDKDTKLKKATFAYWNEKSGLRATRESFYSRRNSLDGKILRVVTLDVNIYFPICSDQTFFQNYIIQLLNVFFFIETSFNRINLRL